MTKLLEWCCGLSVYLAVWAAFVSKTVSLGLHEQWDQVIFYFPVLTVLALGVYAATVVLWRVYCFNDCPEAAKELQQQIKMAREDLKKKGLEF